MGDTEGPEEGGSCSQSEGLCISLLTSFQICKMGLWVLNQIHFCPKWGLKPDLQAFGNQDGVQPPTVMVTCIT